MLLGLVFRGLAGFYRTVPILRVAGPGYMLVGGFVALYEVGGWRLLIGAPIAVAAAYGGTTVADTRTQESFKARASQELQDDCPLVPGAAIDALRAAGARQYETNKLRVEAEWSEAAVGSEPPVRWKITVSASRPNMFQSWSLETIEAWRGEPVVKSPNDRDWLPPQTRHWDDSAQAIHWESVWSKGE